MVLLPVVALVGAGCGGINASQGVSPATFLMPGILKSCPCPPSSTNAPLLSVDSPGLIASVR